MASAQLIKALVQILGRDRESSSRSESLDREATIHELSEHALDGIDLVDNVKMAFLVNSLIEGAGKLLHWMN